MTIRHGHGVHPDGSLDDRSNMYSYGDDVEFHLEAVARGEQGFVDYGEHYDHRARQTDTYVLAGHGSETWEPRFTLHGFRYAAVSCDTDQVTVENIEARHARTSVAETEGFECSDPLLKPDPQQRHLDVRVLTAGIPPGRRRPVRAGRMARRPGRR